MKITRTVPIAIIIFSLCMPIVNPLKNNSNFENMTGSFQSQLMDDWFKLTIMFGQITNSSEERKYIHIEAVRLLYVQFRPIRIRFFNSHEKFLILNQYIGKISSSLTFGIFRATSEEIEYESISDHVNDVFDMHGNIVSENPYIEVKNLDITKLSYCRMNNNVSLTCTVLGEIENRNNGTFPYKFDAVQYYISLETTKRYYEIRYVNHTCNFTYYDDEGDIISKNISTFKVDNDTLIVEFNLVSVDEYFKALLGESDYLYFTLDPHEFYSLYDSAPNPNLHVEIFAPSYGEINNPINFSTAVLFGYPPYTYYWDFGDGEHSTGKNTTHTYYDPGVYNVTVTVTDHFGDTANDNHIIEIVANYSAILKCSKG